MYSVLGATELEMLPSLQFVLVSCILMLLSNQDRFWNQDCFSNQILLFEIRESSQWLPVHHGSSRFDSMHFVVVIMILYCCSVAGFDNFEAAVRFQLMSDKHYDAVAEQSI